MLKLKEGLQGQEGPAKEKQYLWKTMARQFVATFIFHFFFKQNRDLANQFHAQPEILQQEFDSFLTSYKWPDQEHPNNQLCDRGRALAQQMIWGIVEKFEILEETITTHLRKDWKMPHLRKIDHALLLVGVYELTVMSTPPQVVISEIVDIAKIYGLSTSSSFINGVLDAVAK